jgi:hypothetical protein
MSRKKVASGIDKTKVPDASFKIVSSSWFLVKGIKKRDVGENFPQTSKVYPL